MKPMFTIKKCIIFLFTTFESENSSRHQLKINWNFFWKIITFDSFSITVPIMYQKMLLYSNPINDLIESRVNKWQKIFSFFPTYMSIQNNSVFDWKREQFSTFFSWHFLAIKENTLIYLMYISFNTLFINYLD